MEEPSRIKTMMANILKTTYIYLTMFALAMSFYIARGFEFFIAKIHPFVHIVFNALGMRCPL